MPNCGKLKSFSPGLRNGLRPTLPSVSSNSEVLHPSGKKQRLSVWVASSWIMAGLPLLLMAFSSKANREGSHTGYGGGNDAAPQIRFRERQEGRCHTC